MNRVLSLLFFGAAAACLFSPPAFAQEAQKQEITDTNQPVNPARVQALKRIIEAQQRQLETQQGQLGEQQKQLHNLRQQVQTLAGAPDAETHIQTEPAGTLGRRTDTQTTRRDENHPHDQWEGSFAVEGLNTRLKIGGFVELDAIHDTDAIASKGQFVTSTIATRGATKAQGADGQTNFSVNPTRLYIETRTPMKQHGLKTFLSVDFFGEALGVQPDPRMRQAYGEITDILFGGDLLVGQAWTTFADLEAFPNVLDFQGPNSFFGTRQPLIRWTKGVSSDLKLMIAAETPDNHIIQEADALTAWPDGVFSMIWDRARVHLMGSMVARDLRASSDNGPTQTALGWGGSISGKVGLPFMEDKDNITFSATYGEGIGSNFNDQPPDAVFDSAGTSLETIPVFGWFVSYEHWWSRQFNSTFVYGALDVDNPDVQPADAFKNSQYASGNLVWMPNDRWLLGVEGLWGERVDKDGANGSDFRLQFTTKFVF